MFGHTVPKSHDRGPKQHLKSKFLKRFNNLRFQFFVAFNSTRILFKRNNEMFCCTTTDTSDRFKVFLYHFQVIVFQLLVFGFSETQLFQSTIFENYFNQFLVFAVNLHSLLTVHCG